MPRQLLIGTRKGLFTATKKGRKWSVDKPDFLGVPVSMVLHDGRDDSVYAGLDHGHFGVKLQRRVGKRWRELAAPAYPQKKGRMEQTGFGLPWPRTLKMIWSLEIDPRVDGGIWCGTIPGGLFHSADHGSSWQWNSGLWNYKGRKKWSGGGYDQPGIHSVLVDPRDADVVTVGISVAGAYRTEDGGKQWRNVSHGMRAAYMPKEQAFDVDVQDPHRLAMCTAEPDRIWCQHHNGIFVTKQDGASWREVKKKAPSRFGFACAAHAKDPDTAWFVPAQKDECRVPVDGKIVVLRTEDGGKSLDVLRRGLPQRSAYDLVLRHSLDLCHDNKTLAMGSTSGRVWIGEDGGEDWAEIDACLPPVYCLRWRR